MRATWIGPCRLRGSTLGFINIEREIEFNKTARSRARTVRVSKITNFKLNSNPNRKPSPLFRSETPPAVEKTTARVNRFGVKEPTNILLINYYRVLKRTDIQYD